ncbi:MAG: succinate dehydrogenase assembly factor 2 [Gammaproteobacteria bacterium]|nr:succinate dehydrogenase assembly factor 2 [Gammaproteobacteria bacterium]MCY4211680.1 succinate dehydrogenase assembly factor 2 [Gammaproteobacteria bacterium]MCY4281940.1 succinate dehydrogenase assembly factor 2 [Gammaproteobacteria bacterium]
MDSCRHDAQESLKRLYWRCRRGTRELDLLLLRFLERDYPGLSATEQSLFGDLLDESDPDLYAWLSGQCEPSNPDYLRIIGRIKGTSKRS